MMPSLSSALPHIHKGKVRALAVTSIKRISDLPDVPTVAETIRGFEVVSWWGLVGPAGIPDAIVSQLNASLSRILSQPDIGKKLAVLGMVATPGTPQEFEGFIKSEVAKWGRVVRETGVPLE